MLYIFSYSKKLTIIFRNSLLTQLSYKAMKKYGGHKGMISLENYPMHRAEKSLTEPEAFCIIDDWITKIFIEGKFAIKALSMNYEPRIKYNEDMVKAAWTKLEEITTENNGKGKKNELGINLLYSILSDGLRSGRKAKLLDDLHYITSHRHVGLSTGNSFTRFSPHGFTSHHVFLLIRQVELYAKFESASHSSILQVTKRYGDPQLTVISKRKFKSGQLVPELVGRTVNLSESDEIELSLRNSKWDFSVIFPSSKKSRQLFFGPARFVNHDCKPNVQLERIGRDLAGFRVVRDINSGEEIFTNYGDSYFGDENIECLCQSCVPVSERST